jgi:hypothetical protein
MEDNKQNLTMSSANNTVIENNQKEEFHSLYDKWILYAHLPHDTNWKVDSYKTILSFDKVEQAIGLFETIPEIMLNNCMLFLMRNDIKPVWEDDENRKGCCLSFKVSNREVKTVWKKLCYAVIGRQISTNETFTDNVNGVTISPKRSFCIVKIWMKGCEYRTASCVNSLIGINTKDALFKKHTPEY